MLTLKAASSHLSASGSVCQADLCAPAGSAADPARAAVLSRRPSAARSAEQQGRRSGQRPGVKGDGFHTLPGVSVKHCPLPSDRKRRYNSISLSKLNSTNEIKLSVFKDNIASPEIKTTDCG